MELLITNFDLEKDSYTKRHYSLEKYGNSIRNYNHGENPNVIIYNPFSKSDDLSDFKGLDYVFDFIRSNEYNGITAWGVPNKAPQMHEGYPELSYRELIAINPKLMPILSIDTLVAYMPHISWDEFGNHLRLNGSDADTLFILWNIFLRQKAAYFWAINQGYYPHDKEESLLRYIYIQDEKNLYL